MYRGSKDAFLNFFFFFIASFVHVLICSIKNLLLNILVVENDLNHLIV